MAGWQENNATVDDEELIVPGTIDLRGGQWTNQEEEEAFGGNGFLSSFVLQPREKVRVDGKVECSGSHAESCCKGDFFYRRPVFQARQ